MSALPPAQPVLRKALFKWVRTVAKPNLASFGISLSAWSCASSAATCAPRGLRPWHLWSWLTRSAAGAYVALATLTVSLALASAFTKLV